MRRNVLLVVVFGLLAAPLQAQIPGGAFTTHTVATASGATGIASSLAIGGDGLGLITYWDEPSGLVKVAHCQQPSCASVETSDIGPGLSVSRLVSGSDGLGVIAYTAPGAALKVARCVSPSCAAFNTSTVDTLGYNPAMTILGDGLPLLAYYASNNLRVAGCLDDGCTSATITTIVASGDVSPYVDVVTGPDGRGLVAYIESTTGDLKLLHCSDPRCTAATASTVASASAFGIDLAIGPDGRAVIAYTRNITLMVARCSDLDCTSATVSQLTPDGYGGSFPRITIGRDGFPLVGFCAAHTPTVDLLHCVDVSCSSASRVSLEGLVADGLSMAVGADDRLLVSYADGTGDYHLVTAHQAPRGDFDTDGRTDLVWRRDGSGDNLVWFMNGRDLTGASFTNPPTFPDTNWRIVGTNDFNLDARTDLLWRHEISGQNVVWFMNGVNLIGGTFTTPAALADTRWQMVGTGDFDRDGWPDILWRHGFSGENVLWYMNGTTLASGTFLTPASLPDTRWKMAGVADFNRDGQQDILWHHSFSGEVVLWYMNGSVLASGTFTSPSSLPDPNWTIAAVGDYDANGNPDIVWHHDVSGQTVLWFMNGATLVTGTFTNPSTFPDTNWKPVGPR
jgi:hypothetical protein